MLKTRSPCGSWGSLISAESLAKDVVGITAPRIASGLQAPANRAFFYIETNCDGRGTIKSIENGQTASITPESIDVGNTINGYGGGSFIVSASGTLVFTDTSGAIGQMRLDSYRRFGPLEVLIKDSGIRYGDIASHPSTSLVLAVREQRHARQKYPETSIVCIDTNTASVTLLRSGADFYSHPRFSPDGRLVCWLEWDHPHMPWTGARLYVAALSHDGLAPGVDAATIRRVGNHNGVSQPRWGLNDNALFYACDETGYQQLYCVSVVLDAGSNTVSCSDPQWLRIKDFEDTELAGAEFWLGSKTYLELRQDVLLVAYTRDATSYLALVDRVSGTCVDVDIAINDIAYDAIERVNDKEFLVVGAAANRPTALCLVSIPEDMTIWRKNLGAAGNKVKLPCRVTELAQTFDISKMPAETLSIPQAITFPRRAASQSGATSDDSKHPIAAEPALGYAFLMLPTNSDFEPADAADLPPCLVVAHGGPTKHHRPSINLESGQYWTSRGYAVVLLNHVGSTGHGRAYRDALDGRWGEADVADAVDCVESLVGAGVVDGRRVGITGVSAGGYLTMQAACTEPRMWASGVSVCGIGDMRGFAATSHKFERCYDWLLVRGRGALEGAGVIISQGDAREESGLDRGQDGGAAAIARPLEGLYHARSPIKHVEGLKAPLLLLQGEDDEVVTPDQATTFAAAFRQQHLAASGGDGGEAQVALVMYDGEGHGFHSAKTKEDALRRQEEWWSRTLLSRTI